MTTLDTKTTPDPKDFDIPNESDRKHFRFVANGIGTRGYGTWGRGQTEAEALANMRQAGFRGKMKGRVRVYEFDVDTLGAHVDGDGSPAWWGPGSYKAKTL
jgi:hypothetical protein